MALLRELETRGSIAAVSRALGISSSAISQQLSKLEAEVGLTLLEQVGRRLELTQAGIDLSRHAEQAVRVLEEAESALERRRERVQGVVRFAAFSTFALRYLPAVLSRMARSHPDVVVEFSQVEPFEALDSIAGRRADVAVTDEYPGIPRRVDVGVIRTHLLRDRMIAYAPTPVESAAALAGIPWVFEPADTDSAAWSMRICRAAGLEPHVRFESPDLRVHHMLAFSGAAAALLPEMLMQSPTAPLPEPPHRVPWRSAAALLHRDIHAVTRRGSATRPAVAALLSHLQAVTARS